MSDRVVFHVEDDDGDARMVARGFAKAGCDALIDRAVDGRDALQRLEQFATGEAPLPRLMLLDLKLPYVPGIEVLRFARSQERLKDLPIVILTSSDGEEDRRATRECGCSEYAVKPFDYDAFLDVIRGLSERYL